MDSTHVPGAAQGGAPGPDAAAPPAPALAIDGRTWSEAAIRERIPHDPADPAQAAGARRMFAVRELLLARAAELGIAGGDDEATVAGLLAREVSVPEPTDAECRRFFDSDPAAHASPRRFEVAHILFAVVPGVPVDALRRRAEAVLQEVVARPQRFAALARECSNCPSGAAGGSLGWLSAVDCASEFHAALVAAPGDGVLPTLVRTRFGLHVVRIDARAGGELPAFEAVRGAVAHRLRARAETQALRQYVSLLAGRHRVEGCDLAPSPSPLVQ